MYNYFIASIIQHNFNYNTIIKFNTCMVKDQKVIIKITKIIKSYGLLSTCYVQGTVVNALHVLLCCAQSLSHVRLFATPWTVAQKPSQSMGFFRQEYWRGLPCPPPGIFPTQGSNPGFPHCRRILYHLSNQRSPYTYQFI